MSLVVASSQIQAGRNPLFGIFITRSWQGAEKGVQRGEASLEGVWGCPPDTISTPFLSRNGAGGWSKTVFHHPVLVLSRSGLPILLLNAKEFIGTIDRPENARHRLAFCQVF